MFRKVVRSISGIVFHNSSYSNIVTRRFFSESRNMKVGIPFLIFVVVVILTYFIKVSDTVAVITAKVTLILKNHLRAIDDLSQR